MAWETPVCRRDGNYTFYFPLDERLRRRELEAVLLLLDGGSAEIKPELWSSAYPQPYVRRRLELQPR